VTWLAALAAGTAGAQEPAPEPLDDEAPLLGFRQPEIHGFVSQGYVRSISNNYLTRTDSTRGSFELTELGLNFTQPLSEQLRAGIQLFARDLGPVGNYSIKADWFYLDFRWADWLGMRGGRTKLPFGLYNEINDIDAARGPILMPLSVYPIHSRDFLAQTGVEVYGRLATGMLGTLDYRLYYGSIFAEVVPTGLPGPQVVDLQVPYLYGGRLLWETPLEGLRLGGSAQKLRLDGLIVQNTTLVEVKAPIVMWVASLEYAAGALSLAVEYGRWHGESTSSDPAISQQRTVDDERGYVMAAWRLTDWLEPSAYYALYFPDLEDRTGTKKQQHDVSLTLQEHWLLKLEGHYLLGTAGIPVGLNSELTRPTTELERTWALFLAKVTAYF
jgi:hypothetical protein